MAEGEIWLNCSEISFISDKKAKMGNDISLKQKGVNIITLEKMTGLTY
jgi:hypothetical protein